ncbi:hypothetical protein Np050604_055 [Cyanophage S-RIM44]|uniref:Uncharacterized protein n=2 Tax=Vellamovirus TaxID=2733139 RepID=A0A127KMX6_9CAUD|nr:hypothetical protein Syn1_052 [Prochlorococcus phage Syn1]YP_009783189.1 hypothetical protein HOQ83_gp214 [Cyanophage S-RIM44]ADO99153.1 hypothetical protein Syn1_052 [Prochlorococcus phage Syn1]AMO43299.1 hypothetical protein W270710_055 [Cyanophage S-RIM44]AOO11533.1 hypothetical protein ES420910_052 [Cyanophage S-RIM44]AOO11771.1 hypothetical protein Np050604_055 [Cyanophage S-RIM44]AOO11998.1 hypothetical protein Np200711_052 [Cyanophage S-RIM44]
MNSSPKISSQNSDTVSVDLTIGEVQYLIDCMWSQTRHDSQALAFRHNINDVELERRLSHTVADHSALNS